MKQLKLLFPILVFLALPWVICSCCEYEYGPEQSSENKFHAQFSDFNYYFQKVELIGSSKLTYSTEIILNPSDTVSTYRIFYGRRNLPDSSWSGLLSIGYIPKPYTIDSECKSEEVMAYYNMGVSSTTFTHVRINGNIIQITP